VVADLNNSTCTIGLSNTVTLTPPAGALLGSGFHHISHRQRRGIHRRLLMADVRTLSVLAFALVRGPRPG
jgi:hypothetical protein